MNPSDDCKEVSIGTPLPSVTYHTPYYGTASFNPNNADEFVYVEGVPENRVVVYNRETEEKRTLYEGYSVFFQPKWGKNGWILLNLSDSQIWKIKSDGDSLTQLTFEGSHFHPEWNSTGDAFICQQNLSNTINTVIYNDMGEQVDILSDFNLGSFIVWYRPEHFLSNTYNSIYTFDLADSMLTEVAFFDRPDFGGMVLLKDTQHIVWSYVNGIFKTNIETLATEELKATCNSQHYLFPTYAKETDQIIFRELSKEFVEPELLKQSSRLVIMDSNGGNEQVIEIPE